MKLDTAQVKIYFADELDRCIRAHFSKFPSNEYFSRELYRSSSYKVKVSRETVRKWLKGESFPDLVYLLHLIDWLGLDMSNVFVSGDFYNKDKVIRSNSKQNVSQILPPISAEQIELFLKYLNTINTDILKLGQQSHS